MGGIDKIKVKIAFLINFNSLLIKNLEMTCNRNYQLPKYAASQIINTLF